MVLKGVLKKRYKRLDAGCPVADFYERETGLSQLGPTLFVCVCCENGQSIWNLNCIAEELAVSVFRVELKMELVSSW
jgi:hypothetical protein